MDSARYVRWLGMSMWIPDEWEIVRHSVREERGQLSFVDRRKQRLQVAWSACSRRPDTKWVFDDFRARDKHRTPDCEIDENFQFEKWTGYHRTAEGQTLTRAGMYDHKFKRWIDVAIPWNDSLDEDFEKELLHNFRTVGPDKGRNRIDAFDIHLDTPESWVLSKAEVGPAETVFTFDSGRGEVKVRRRAMPEAWFDGHLEHLLQRSTAGKWRGSYSFRSSRLHETCAFEGREKQFSPRWFVQRRTLREDRAWLCPESNAIFQVTSQFPRKEPLSPEEVNVHCCKAQEAQA